MVKNKYILSVALILLSMSLLFSQDPGKEYIVNAVVQKNIEKLENLVEFEKELYPSNPDLISNSAFRKFNECREFYIIDFLVQNKYLNYSSQLAGGWTPFSLACQCSEKKFIKNTFKANPPDEIAQRDYYNFNPYIVAAGRRDFKLVKYLERNQFKGIGIEDKFGMTALHLAAKTNHFRMVKYLVKLGHSVEATDVIEYRPVNYAAKTGSKKSVKYLLSQQKTSLIPRQEYNLLWASVSYGRYRLLKYLLKRDDGHVRGVDAFKQTLLFRVVDQMVSRENIIKKFIYKIEMKKSKKIFELLLDYELDINAIDDDGHTILFIGKDSYDVTEYLISKGLDINTKGVNNVTVIEHLVERLLHPMETIMFGEPVRFGAGYDNKLEMFQVISLLDRHGAIVAYPFTSGANMLLLSAIKNNDYELVDFLISNEIDLNGTDLLNRTALDYEIENDNDFMVAILNSNRALKGEDNNNN